MGAETDADARTLRFDLHLGPRAGESVLEPDLDDVEVTAAGAEWFDGNIEERVIVGPRSGDVVDEALGRLLGVDEPGDGDGVAAEDVVGRDGVLYVGEGG